MNEQAAMKCLYLVVTRSLDRPEGSGTAVDAHSVTARSGVLAAPRHARLAAADHPVWFILDTLEAFDLMEFEAGRRRGVIDAAGKSPESNKLTTGPASACGTSTPVVNAATG